MSGAVDPEAGRALMLGWDRFLRVYSYPDFKPERSYWLGVKVYQAVLDRKRGLLYAAVCDAQALVAKEVHNRGIPQRKDHPPLGEESVLARDQIARFVQFRTGFVSDTGPETIATRRPDGASRRHFATFLTPDRQLCISGTQVAFALLKPTETLEAKG